jgi:hypothetical protein
VAIPAALQPVVASWASYYGDHQLISVAVRYLHLSSILVGGGTAVALDRQVVRAVRADGDARRAVLAHLRGSHRVVVPSLGVIVATGIAMTAADLDTFMTSNLYWAKLGFVALLLLNGALLLAAESAAERSAGAGWGRVTAAAVASMALWFATLFVGTWLTVGA